MVYSPYDYTFSQLEAIQPPFTLARFSFGRVGQWNPVSLARLTESMTALSALFGYSGQSSEIAVMRP